VEERLPILIDTDPGIDDFFCLAMALAFGESLRVTGVSTEGGNADPAVTTRNALDILYLLGRPDIPVAKGSTQYLLKPFGRPAVKFHGENGLGGVQLVPSPQAADARQAWDLLHDCACQEDGKLVVLTIGPLTNIAVALGMFPVLKKKIRRIVMMGGTTDTGNIGPYTEANMGHDALASHIVFQSGIPIDMVGLNVTRKCFIRPEELASWSAGTKPEIRTVMRQLFSFRGAEPMHDPVACASLLDGGILSWREARTEIECSQLDTSGRCLIDFQSTNPNSRIAMDIDVDRYKALFAAMLKRLA
jgi:inosine-uridine nucleoside N-ribohydrolase